MGAGIGSDIPRSTIYPSACERKGNMRNDFGLNAIHHHETAGLTQGQTGDSASEGLNRVLLI